MSNIYKRIIGGFLVSICMMVFGGAVASMDVTISFWDGFWGSGIILLWILIFGWGLHLIIGD